MSYRDLSSRCQWQCTYRYRLVSARIKDPPRESRSILRQMALSVLESIKGTFKVTRMVSIDLRYEQYPPYYSEVLAIFKNFSVRVSFYSIYVWNKTTTGNKEPNEFSPNYRSSFPFPSPSLALFPQIRITISLSFSRITSVYFISAVQISRGNLFPKTIVPPRNGIPNEKSIYKSGYSIKI